MRHQSNHQAPAKIVGASDAMLEFETEIVEFKVMVRPLKAINLIHQRTAAMLQAKQ